MQSGFRQRKNALARRTAAGGSASGRTAQYLEKDFAGLDHAQLVAGTFLDGFVSLFEVAYIGRHRRIACEQPLVHRPLLGQLAFDLHDADPAALAEPHGPLQDEDADDKNEGDGAHGR